MKNLGLHYKLVKTLLVRISHKNKIMGFEAPIYPSVTEFNHLQVNHANVLLQLKNQDKKISDPVAITKWGGYALYPYVTRTLPNERSRWLLNPFIFLSKALHDHLPIIPDVSTMNGKRIMLVHIDGDGFNSKAEWLNGPIAGSVIEKDILERFKVPTTVSFVEGELAPNGITHLPQQKHYFSVARSILAMPWVEPASHSYGHPFDWRKIVSEKNIAPYHIPLKNYKYSPKREIVDSVDFINRYLTPKNKPCKVFLWTGLANPNKAAVAAAYQAGLLNMNGGNTSPTNNNPSLTLISPLGIWRGKYYQVYAPIMNENIYTNEWTGPFWGFRRVIETFKLTNTPRRLKPIDIYYHFYSGTKPAALNALIDVYQWANQQNVIHLFASQYIRKVLNFQNVVIAQDLNNNWWVFHATHDKEMRIAQNLGKPNLLQSQNLLGFSPYRNTYYLHLGAPTAAKIVFNHRSPTVPYLVQTNAEVHQFHRQGSCITMSLNSHLPIRLTLAHARNCVATLGSKTITGKAVEQNAMRYILKETHVSQFKLCCPTKR